MKKKNDPVAASYVAAVEYAYRFRKQTERSIKASEKAAITPILSKLKDSVPRRLQAFCEEAFSFDAEYSDNGNRKRFLYALFAHCMNPKDHVHTAHHFSCILISKGNAQACGYVSAEAVCRQIPALSRAWKNFLRVRLQKQPGGNYFLIVEIPFARMEAEAPKELRTALKLLRKEKL